MPATLTSGRSKWSGRPAPTSPPPAPPSSTGHRTRRAAWFWANDEDGTYKPPGQLLQATRDIATAHKLNTYVNARLFALVSIAMTDAGIAVRDVKFLTPVDLWRPVSAIREGGLDPEWKPLLKNRAGINFNPCFPAWASGHATFGAAWAGVMKRYFNSDDIAFTSPSPASARPPARTRTAGSGSGSTSPGTPRTGWSGRQGRGHVFRTKLVSFK